MSKRVDFATIAPVIGTIYPSPFDEPCRKRERRKLGDAAGLTQFDVNLLRLPPGSWSSQRHRHTKEDEFALFSRAKWSSSVTADPVAHSPTL
jgi:uncharacterized cupin superfamily protein